MDKRDFDLHERRSAIADGWLEPGRRRQPTALELKFMDPWDPDAEDQSRFV